MFYDIGKRLKGHAKVVFFMGIAIFAVIGAVMGTEEGGIGITIVFILVGSLITSTISLFAYGLGELIDNAAAIYNKLNEEKVSDVIECEYCGFRHKGITSSCPNCGRRQ